MSDIFGDKARDILNLSRRGRVNIQVEAEEVKLAGRRPGGRTGGSLMDVGHEVCRFERILCREQCKLEANDTTVQQRRRQLPYSYLSVHPLILIQCEIQEAVLITCSV